jgi:hypothetical protein
LNKGFLMREARFVIESLGETVFDGYTQGEDWNGWACPFFTFEQAQRIVDAHNEHGIKAWYDEAADLFAFDLNQTGDDDVDAFPSVALEGRTLYPIGSGCWIWEEEQAEESVNGY